MAGVWGRVQAFLTGAAVSRASSDAVGPVMEPVRQRSNQKNAVRVIDPGTLAELVAKLIVDQGEADAEALRSGVNANRLQALLLLAQVWPGLGELDRLSNREIIDMDEVILALQRHGYPQELIGTAAKPGPLVQLFSDILTPGELAAAVHRGLVPAEGLLLGEQPEGLFKVDAYPVQDIDAIKEAAGSGYDKKRLQVLVGLQGLPMGPHEAAQAFFRGIITHGDYIRAFNTSNMRNEWAQAILDQTRQIPTARDFFENALRGYHDLSWAQKEAERHGMSKEDSLIIYQNQGRPMNVHAITQALARGGKFKPEPGEQQDPYDAAIIEGNLKPAYYDLAKANRYSYSVPFWWRTLLTSGAIKPPEAEQLLLNLGNPPDLAKRITDHFAASLAVAAVDPWVNKARNQLWTAIHRSFLNGELDRAGADSKLTTLILDLGARSEVLDLWTIEDEATTKPLSPANVKKGYKAGDYTIDEAAARLVSQQWAAADANTYLTT